MATEGSNNNFFSGKASFARSSGDSGDIIKRSRQEMEENAACAQQATFLNRQSIKAQGYDVTALNKKQHSRNYDPESANTNEIAGGGSGLDLESHPELPYMGGKADQIMFPESEVESIPESQLSSQQKEKKAEAKKKQQDRNRQQLANRMKHQIKIVPKQQPTQRPKNSPGYTPPKLKPPGS